MIIEYCKRKLSDKNISKEDKKKLFEILKEEEKKLNFSQSFYKLFHRYGFDDENNN